MGDSLSHLDDLLLSYNIHLYNASRFVDVFLGLRTTILSINPSTLTTSTLSSVT